MSESAEFNKNFLSLQRKNFWWLYATASLDNENKAA